MSCYDQNQFEAATSVAPYTAPPLVVIPMKDIEAYPQNPPPTPLPGEIKAMDDDLLKGCCDDLCCYWCLDFCF